MSVSVKDRVSRLDGLASEQEELHGNIAQCKELLLATSGANLPKVANAALQDLEVKATKFREHANGMHQGESWTVGLED